MALCRWSSDNWECDLYIYEDVSGGYTTHVAANRYVGTAPPFDFSGPDAFEVTYKEQRAFLDTAERAPIGGPYDGRTFHDSDAEDLADRLRDLRAAGYRFPDGVLEWAAEEASQ